MHPYFKGLINFAISKDVCNLCLQITGNNIINLYEKWLKDSYKFKLNFRFCHSSARCLNWTDSIFLENVALEGWSKITFA